MAYVFDFTNQLIEIVEPQNIVDIQELINAIRMAEESEVGIAYSKIANASGKETLGGSVSVGITLELLDWQLHFWEGDDYTATISGGNLVGGAAGDTIAYTAGVQVIVIQSAASTVVSVGGSALTSEEHNQLMSTGTVVDRIEQKTDDNTALIIAS
jgi:hypothetical protein